jgi:hypothetical protein
VDPGKTIGVNLWAGQARGAGVNLRTCMGSVPSVRAVAAERSLRALFLDGYGRFADLCREVDEPGIALLAVDERTGRPAGLVRLRARPGRHVAAIVGRHDECDLYLDGHASLALRHLAVVLEPVRSWQPGDTSVRYRVLDLRTERGFADEDGRPMRGLHAEGPAFMRCAGHAIFVLPLGDPSDWPASPTDAWDMLPERVYFDELEHVPESSMPRMYRATSTRRSMVFRTHGPRDTGMGLVERGDMAGYLELIGKHRRGTLTLGDRALRDGVLIGRYARCDGAALLDDPALSRVHLLLLHVEHALLAIDTASSNGTSLPGEDRARVIAIEKNTELSLGKSTRLRWHWSD